MQEEIDSYLRRYPNGEGTLTVSVHNNRLGFAPEGNIPNKRGQPNEVLHACLECRCPALGEGKAYSRRREVMTRFCGLVCQYDIGNVYGVVPEGCLRKAMLDAYRNLYLLAEQQDYQAPGTA